MKTQNINKNKGNNEGGAHNMARIAGVDIPREKRVVISLTYIFGIGRPTAAKSSCRSWCF